MNGFGVRGDSVAQKIAVDTAAADGMIMAFDAKTARTTWFINRASLGAVHGASPTG